MCVENTHPWEANITFTPILTRRAFEFMYTSMFLCNESLSHDTTECDNLINDNTN